MSPSLKSSALIAIDVQRGFVTEASAEVVPVIADITNRWQLAGGRTVLTRFVNMPTSNYVRLIGWSKMMPGDADVVLTEEMQSLADTASIVVDKQSYSALTPSVIDWLHRQDVTDVWLAGFDTESCVLITAHALFDAQFTPWVLTDAVASHAGTAAHEAGLFVLGRNIGVRQLVTIASLPAEVQRHQAVDIEGVRRGWSSSRGDLPTST